MALEQVGISPSDRGPALSGLQFSEETLAGRDSGLPEIVSPARNLLRAESAGEVGAQRMLGLANGLTALLSGYRSETPSSSAQVEAGPSLLSPHVAGQEISNIRMPEASPVPDQQQPAPGPATPPVAGSAQEEGSGAAPQGPEPAALPASAAKRASKRKATSQPLPGVPPSQQNYDFLGKLSAGQQSPWS